MISSDAEYITYLLGNPDMVVGEEMRGQEETTKKMMMWVYNTYIHTCVQLSIVLALLSLKCHPSHVNKTLLVCNHMSVLLSDIYHT